VSIVLAADGDADDDAAGLHAEPLIVKALDAELRLKKLLLSDAACRSQRDATSQACPPEATHDPSSPSDAHYLAPSDACVHPARDKVSKQLALSRANEQARM